MPQKTNAEIFFFNFRDMLPFILPLLLISPVFSSENCDLETKVLTNLWRINTHHPSYFFGTLHVPYTRVWHGISEQAKRAFQSADQVYLEREFGGNSCELLKKKMSMAERLTIRSCVESMKSENCHLLPTEKNLTDLLSPELMRRLRDHMGWIRTEIASLVSLTHNHPINNWEKIRPQYLR